METQEQTKQSMELRKMEESIGYQSSHQMLPFQKHLALMKQDVPFEVLLKEINDFDNIQGSLNFFRARMASESPKKTQRKLSTTTLCFSKKGNSGSPWRNENPRHESSDNHASFMSKNSAFRPFRKSLSKHSSPLRSLKKREKIPENERQRRLLEKKITKKDLLWLPIPTISSDHSKEQSEAEISVFKTPLKINKDPKPQSSAPWCPKAEKCQEESPVQEKTTSPLKIIKDSEESFTEFSLGHLPKKTSTKKEKRKRPIPRKFQEWTPKDYKYPDSDSGSFTSSDPDSFIIEDDEFDLRNECRAERLECQRFLREIQKGVKPKKLE